LSSAIVFYAFTFVHVIKEDLLTYLPLRQLDFLVQ